MTYIDYKSKEDLQDDTFKQIAYLNWNCMVSISNKDVESIVSCMNILYLTCWKKMGSYMPEDFENSLKEIELRVNKDIDDYERTKLLLAARDLYKQLSGGLSEAGLLFRATVTSSDIGKREEL